MDVVFALLAAMLHLCNIEMANDPESEEVIVMNEDELDYGMYYNRSHSHLLSQRVTPTSSSRTWLKCLLPC